MKLDQAVITSLNDLNNKIEYNFDKKYHKIITIEGLEKFP